MAPTTASTLSPAKQLIYIEERERVGVMRDPDMGIVMFGPMLMRWGTEEQKKKYLPRIVEQKDIWCQGYSEPNAGSDLAGLQTTAVLDGDHYVVNGSKIWTSSGHWADHMFFLARTDKNAKKQEGITFFVLDDIRNIPGFTVRPILNIANHDEFAQEYFENVRVPKENVVGEVNKGWTVAKSLLGFERLFKDGRMGVVHGCSYPNPDRSDFVARRYWHTGSPNVPEERGWVGRFADYLAQTREQWMAKGDFEVT